MSKEELKQIRIALTHTYGGKDGIILYYRMLAALRGNK